MNFLLMVWVFLCQLKPHSSSKCQFFHGMPWFTASNKTMHLTPYELNSIVIVLWASHFRFLFWFQLGIPKRRPFSSYSGTIPSPAARLYFLILILNGNEVSLMAIAAPQWRLCTLCDFSESGLVPEFLFF